MIKFSDGNRACGIYCATQFICDRIKEEQLVDVFLSVQTIRTNRPNFVTDLVLILILILLMINNNNCVNILGSIRIFTSIGYLLFAKFQ